MRGLTKADIPVVVMGGGMLLAGLAIGSRDSKPKSYADPERLYAASTNALASLSGPTGIKLTTEQLKALQNLDGEVKLYRLLK